MLIHLKPLRLLLMKRKVSFIQKVLKVNTCLFGIVALVSLDACNVYDTKGIISKGDAVIAENRARLLNLARICDSLAQDSCALYQVHFSSTTAYFTLSEYIYKTEESFFSEEKLLDVDQQVEDIIRAKTPTKAICEMNFSKSLYVAFMVNNIRDESYNYAKVIYVKDKDRFQQIFDNWLFFEKGDEGKIEDKTDWVYFYDEHWAITTSTAFFSMEKEDCKCIMRRNNCYGKVK